MMPNYRLFWLAGSTCFFTVNLLERRGNDLLVREIDLLRDVAQKVRRKHPFIIHAWVLLPEHLHCVIELPEGDADFATRWRLQNELFTCVTQNGKTRRRKVIEGRARHLAATLLGSHDPR